MSNDLSYLPDLPRRFDYLRDVIAHYTRQGRNHPREIWKQSISDLPPAKLQEIVDAYERMRDRGDAAPLSSWIAEHRVAVGERWRAWMDQAEEAERVTGKPPDDAAEPRSSLPAEDLFDLFEFLADERIAPFASRAVQYIPPPLDWNKLPAELRYLSEPATKWGVHQFYEQLDRLARRISQQDLEELKALAHRLRRSGDEARVHEWVSARSLQDHREAALLYFMMILLNEFVPPGGKPGLADLANQPDPFPELDELSPP